MKNIRFAIVILCTLVGTTAASAQNLYDAARLMGNDLNGTGLSAWEEPWEHWEVISRRWVPIRQVLVFIEAVM